MKAQRVTTWKKVELAWYAVDEAPHSGKKLDESVIEEERAMLGK